MNFCTNLKNALSSFWENKKFSHEVIMVESKNIQVHIRSSRAGVGMAWRRQRESAKRKGGSREGRRGKLVQWFTPQCLQWAEPHQRWKLGMQCKDAGSYPFEASLLPPRISSSRNWSQKVESGQSQAVMWGAIVVNGILTLWLNAYHEFKL